MWFEFFLYGLVLSGPVWVYQNTQGRGNIMEIPLWMQQSWVSLLSSIRRFVRLITACIGVRISCDMVDKKLAFASEEASASSFAFL